MEFFTWPSTGVSLRREPGQGSAYKAGGDGYLAKPIDLDEMIRTVQEFSNRPQELVSESR